MKIKVIAKNQSKFVGQSETGDFRIYTSDEYEQFESNDLLFNSTGLDGYFTSKSTGEEFISISISTSSSVEGMSKKEALQSLNS